MFDDEAVPCHAEEVSSLVAVAVSAEDGPLHTARVNALFEGLAKTGELELPDAK